MGLDLAPVEGDDADAFLAAVLQGMQAQHCSCFCLFDPEYADNATLLLQLVIVEGVGADRHAYLFLSNN
jgi:hypothetical protein